MTNLVLNYDKFDTIFDMYYDKFGTIYDIYDSKSYKDYLIKKCIFRDYLLACFNFSFSSFNASTSFLNRSFSIVSSSNRFNKYV